MNKMYEIYRCTRRTKSAKYIRKYKIDGRYLNQYGFIIKPEAGH